MGGKGAYVATGEGEATYNTACGMIDTTILTACHRAALDHWQIEKRQGQSLQTRQHTHPHTTQDIFSRLLALLPPLLLSTLPSPHSLTTILLLVVEHASQETRGQEQGRVHWGVQFLPIFQDDADDAHPLCVFVFVCMAWVGLEAGESKDGGEDVGLRPKRVRAQAETKRRGRLAERGLQGPSKRLCAGVGLSFPVFVCAYRCECWRNSVMRSSGCL